MEYTAAVITISDKGFKGERTDESGPAICDYLKENDWKVIHTDIVPDEKEDIKKAVIKACDEKCANLILTTGGTGFSQRDITPEAVTEVIERMTPGIAEAMRAESMKVTDRACLSRGISGIRKESLIITLPGSKKAALENLAAVISPIRHGVDMLLTSGSADCANTYGKVDAVCISEKKGTIKHTVDSVFLKEDYGIEGDAHAGKWHRQVSLLSAESVAGMQAKINYDLKPGVFAENILVSGMLVYKLPVGTKVKVGEALCEVTQIGKECHADCEIRRKTGDCVMPREGIFVRVLSEGTVKPGDKVEVIR